MIEKGIRKHRIRESEYFTTRNFTYLEALRFIRTMQQRGYEILNYDIKTENSSYTADDMVYVEIEYRATSLNCRNVFVVKSGVIIALR